MSIHPGHKSPFAVGGVNDPNGMDNGRFSSLPHCKGIELTPLNGFPPVQIVGKFISNRNLTPAHL